MNATYFTRGICLLCILCFVSCSDKDIIGRMEQIKMYGNENPEEALVMLDSLEIEVRSAGDYAKHKYDLLKVRLNDKADHMPSSDIMIKELMAYFEEKGSIPDKQEVYYYAGSTYRDLQDTPRALEFFFKSLDFALNHEECDPIMLRNTYSNLNWLFFRVQDYPNAVKFSIKELEMCRQTRTDIVLPFIHLGASYRAIDSIPQAMAMFDSAFAHIIQSGDLPRYQEYLACLLYNYSDMEEAEKAKECIPLIKSNPLVEFDELACMAFALYYKTLGRSDSAIIYFKKVLDDATDYANTYDAASSLFRLYNRADDDTNALKYAKVFIHISDSLNFGKRQELAATVNNQYQYTTSTRRKNSN